MTDTTRQADIHAVNRQTETDEIDRPNSLPPVGGWHPRAQEYWLMALWYAYGRYDQQQATIQETVYLGDTLIFADTVRCRAHVFYSGHSGMLPGVQNMWDEYFQSAQRMAELKRRGVL